MDPCVLRRADEHFAQCDSRVSESDSESVSEIVSELAPARVPSRRDRRGTAPKCSLRPQTATGFFLTEAAEAFRFGMVNAGVIMADIRQKCPHEMRSSWPRGGR